MSLAWALDRRSILKLGLVGACAALRDVVRVRRASAQGAPAIDQRERHLTNLRQFTFGGQNAEAYFDRAGTRLVFQSTRPPFGCDQIFTMRDDGGDARNVRRLTDEPGYDGGAFYSWDGRMIVFRAHRPKTREDIDEYRALLARSLVRPRALELYVMRADGTGLRQVTRNGAANFAPFLHPNGQHIVFASNLHHPRRRSFPP